MDNNYSMLVKSPKQAGMVFLAPKLLKIGIRVSIAFYLLVYLFYYFDEKFK